jgi:hypothetical protein
MLGVLPSLGRATGNAVRQKTITGIADDATGKAAYGLGRENNPFSSCYRRLGAKSTVYPSPGMRTPHSGDPPGDGDYTPFVIGIRDASVASMSRASGLLPRRDPSTRAERRNGIGILSF